MASTRVTMAVCYICKKSNSKSLRRWESKIGCTTCRNYFSLRFDLAFKAHACSSSRAPKIPLSLGRRSRPTFCFVDKGPPYVKFWRSQNFRVFSSGRAKISKKSAIFLIRPHQISCFFRGGARPLRDSDILEHAWDKGCMTPGPTPSVLNTWVTTSFWGAWINDYRSFTTTSLINWRGRAVRWLRSAVRVGLKLKKGKIS